MRILIGITGVIAGIVLGLYLGLYVCFVGGLIDIITQVVNMFNGANVNVVGVVFGIVKMLVASLVGYISAFIVILPSCVLLGLKKK